MGPGSRAFGFFFLGLFLLFAGACRKWRLVDVSEFRLKVWLSMDCLVAAVSDRVLDSELLSV